MFHHFPLDSECNPERPDAHAPLGVPGGDRRRVRGPRRQVLGVPRPPLRRAGPARSRRPDRQSRRPRHPRGHVRRLPRRSRARGRACSATPAPAPSSASNRRRRSSSTAASSKVPSNAAATSTSSPSNAGADAARLASIATRKDHPWNSPKRCVTACATSRSASRIDQKLERDWGKGGVRRRARIPRPDVGHATSPTSRSRARTAST